MKNKKGAGIIEILVAVGIIGVALAALAGLGNFALRMQNHFKNNLEAANLAGEALEVVKLLKSEGWEQISGFSQEIAYHPVLAGTPLKFSLLAGPETIGDFSREIVFSQVFRNMDDDIVLEGGALDQETVRVVSSVSWNEKSRPYRIEFIHYLANWQ